MPKRNLYGYVLLNKVEYRIRSRILVNIYNGRMLRLSKTRGRLLEYFLASAHKRYVSDDEIIIDVWELFGLRGSHSLLAKSVKELHMSLLYLGIDKNIFYRFSKRLFRIETQLIREVRFKKKIIIDEQKEN